MFQTSLMLVEKYIVTAGCEKMCKFFSLNQMKNKYLVYLQELLVQNNAKQSNTSDEFGMFLFWGINL